MAQLLVTMILWTVVCSHPGMEREPETEATQGALPEGVTFPHPPEKGDFVRDAAGLLSPEDAEVVRDACARSAARNKELRIITIPSLAAVGAEGISVQQYLTALSREWSVERGDRDFLILFLVSTEDRDARFKAFIRDEMRRTAFGAVKDMNEAMAPWFKDDRVSEGIREGALTFNRLTEAAIAGEGAPE